MKTLSRGNCHESLTREVGIKLICLERERYADAYLDNKLESVTDLIVIEEVAAIRLSSVANYC
jgi:hypothetical protein